MNPKTTLRLAAAALLAGTLAFAQNTPPQPPDPRQGARTNIAAALELTPDQQQQARAIFAETRQAAQPLMAQLKAARQQLFSAVKSNAPAADIDTISAQIGTLTGQLTAVRGKGFEKLYAILTPEQQSKADARMLQLMNTGFARPRAGRLQPRND